MLSRKVCGIAQLFVFSVWSSAVMLILTLIKDTALTPLASLIACVYLHMPVCLTDRRAATQWSVSIPKLCCSPLLYHCNPGACNCHGILPSIMCSCRGLGTSCQSVCVCVHVFLWNYEMTSLSNVCLCVWNCLWACMHQCVFFCSQMDRSIQVSPARTEEQCPFLQAFVCMCVCEADVALLFKVGHTRGEGGGCLRWGLLAGKKAMTIQVNLASSSPFLHLTCCFVHHFLSAYISFFPFLTHTCLLLQLLFCVCMGTNVTAW